MATFVKKPDNKIQVSKNAIDHMTPIEAEEIIGNFHSSINDLRPLAIVQFNKELPYTAARIKYAHFVLGEDFVKRGKVTEEIFQEMLESYGIIDSFFTEDSESINIKYEEYLEGLRNGIITDFRMPNPFGECVSVNEFQNFLGECWFLEYRTNLLTENALGAFVYEELRNKATRENDVETLIDLINTSKTRTVIFPGRKTNEDSIFIKPN